MRCCGTRSARTGSRTTWPSTPTPTSWSRHARPPPRSSSLAETSEDVLVTLPDSPTFLDFWTERRLCTVTTLRPDGTPHVTPMGVVIDPDSDTAWAITSRNSRKARNLANGGPIAVCCVDGRYWSTIEGT